MPSVVFPHFGGNPSNTCWTHIVYLYKSYCMEHITDQFIAKYSSKLSKNVKKSDNRECIFWSGTRKAGYGVINCKVPGICSRYKLFYVHRLAYAFNKVAKIDLDSFLLKNPLDHQLSHLCHNRTCILPDHLTVETIPINNERKICCSKGLCLGHEGQPECLLHLKA